MPQASFCSECFERACNGEDPQPCVNCTIFAQPEQRDRNDIDAYDPDEDPYFWNTDHATDCSS